MTKEQFIIWLAGFFDGEGSVGVKITSAGLGRVWFYIYQKDVEVLRKIQKVFGGTVREQKYNAAPGGHKERMCSRINWGNTAARPLLALIRPYLQTRKAQKIDEILKTESTRPRRS